MSRVLVIEDEVRLCLALEASLAVRGYDVVAVHGGHAGIEATAAGPDVVVLDLGLPDLDGVEVLRRIRAFSAVPIVVLTARDRQVDKIEALDAGADDYVTKPFDSEELAARLRAALRRAPVVEPITRAVIGDLDIDLVMREFTVRGERVPLTRTEWALLEALVTNPGRLLTHDWLLKRVWGPAYGRETGYLRTYVGQLRRKLEDDASHPRLIRTEPGLGYRWLAGS